MVSYSSGSDWGKELAEKIEFHVKAAEKESTPIMCFYGVGNHGGGPTVQNLKTIDELKAKGLDIIYSDPEKHFKEVSALEKVPVVKDELQYHAIGCYSSLSKVKRANNYTEQQLLFAEKMLAVIGESGDDEKHRALGEGWKKVLTNQFHDSLGGCSIPEAYPKILAAYGWGMETVNQMTSLLFQRLTSKINTAHDSIDGSTLIIWNPNPWETTEAVDIIGVADEVRDLHGNKLPFELVPSNAVTIGFYSHAIRLNVSLPPLGYTSLKLSNFRGSLETGAFLGFQYTRTATNKMVSGDWEAVIDRESGFITSLRNTKTNTEFLDPEGIGPLIIDDESDTWTHIIPSYAGARRKMIMESYTLVSRGDVSVEYEIVYKLFNSTVILRVILNGGLGTLDLKIRVLWNERQRLLKMRIASAFENKSFCSEIPYGSIERSADGKEWPIQRWACLGANSGPCLGVINDGIYSASAEGGALDLTLLRSPIYAHHENQHPRPDIQQRYVDQGEAEFLVQLRPFIDRVGNDVFARHALELNQRAFYVIESTHSGTMSQEQSYCKIRNKSSVLIYTIKRAEDNDGWIIRAVEEGGNNSNAEIDFCWLGVSANFSFSPYEIKTIKIADKDKQISETNILESGTLP
jgi:alpha-mannosidase